MNKDNMVIDSLVSVCVITYNSSKYVLETLDSIYNQSYKKIELVVSDDGSKDNTFSLVEEWLNDKKQRFVNVQVLRVDVNTGTAANCNRAYFAANGVWIKGIAGDDVLLPNAIERFVKYVNSVPKANWIYAKSISYLEKISDDCILKSNMNYEKVKKILGQSSTYQFRRMVVRNFLWYPAFFFRSDFFRNVGGFDESFGIYEDYPMWLKLLRNGEKIYFMDEYVMGYRRSGQSVVNNTKYLDNRTIRVMAFKARKKYAFDRVTWVEKTCTYMTLWHALFFTIPWINKKTRFRNFVFRLSRIMFILPCLMLQKIVKMDEEKC